MPSKDVFQLEDIFDPSSQISEIFFARNHFQMNNLTFYLGYIVDVNARLDLDWILYSLIW